MEIIKSNRCKDVLMHEGFYTLNRKTNAKMYRRCQDRKCNANAVTSVTFNGFNSHTLMIA